MIRPFINRENELALLQRGWKSSMSSFIIIHGRRRIGKTRLIMEFCLNKKGIFYIAEETSKQIQINTLKKEMAAFLNDSLLDTLEIKEWDQLFQYFTSKMPSNRFYFVIDEFSYLIKSDKRILSTFQKYWDLFFSQENIQIILSGSLIGLMQDQVLSYSSPLYGRRTRDILLGLLSFDNSRKFFQMKVQSQLQIYMILGGVPEYLLKTAEYSDFKDFLQKEFFDPQGYFFREPYFLLSQEFREVQIYFAILNAIAYGNTQVSRIANFIGKPTKALYPYLESLLRLKFIQREIPVVGNKKNGIYLIEDAIFDFWFNFVFSNRGKIDRGRFYPANDELNRFFGKKFEKFAREDLIPSIFPQYDQIGRWWYKDEEIDIVALDSRNEEIMFIECKWSKLGLKDVNRLLDQLKLKAESVQWKNSTRKETFGIVGQQIAEKESWRKKGVIIFDVDDLEAIDKDTTT